MSALALGLGSISRGSGAVSIRFLHALANQLTELAVELISGSHLDIF